LWFRAAHLDGGYRLDPVPTLTQDRDVLKPGPADELRVVHLQRGSRDAADVGLDRLTRLLRQRFLQNEVAHQNAPTGSQHPERLAEDAVLLGGEVHHAIRHDDIDRRIRYRQMLDFAEAELDVRVASLRRVFPGAVDHRGCHVHADDAPLRSDLARRQEGIDPRARAEIEHGLTAAYFGQPDRVSASQAQIRSCWYRGGVGRAVSQLSEPARDRVPAALRTARAAASRLALRDRP